MPLSVANLPPYLKYSLVMSLTLIIPILIISYYIPTFTLILLSATLLAYISNPIVDRLERYLGRPFLSFIIAFVFPGLLVIGIIKILPIVISEFIKLGQTVPAILDLHLTPLLAKIGLDFSWSALVVEFPKVYKHFLPNIAQIGQQQLGSLLSWIIHSLLLAMMAFLILRDWKGLTSGGRNYLHNITPDSWNSNIDRIFKEIGASISRLIRGQLEVCSILAVYYGISFHIVGQIASQQFAFTSLWMLFGVMTGFLNLVPYVGVPIGGLIVALFSIMTFQFEVLWIYLSFLLIIAIGVTMDHKMLTPTIIGHHLKVNEIFVYLAIYFGGAIGGMTGIILALPAMVVVIAVTKHLYLLWLECRPHYD